MEKHIYPGPAELTEQLAAFFIASVNKAIKVNGRASVVLAGGNSPKALYQILALKHHHSTEWSKLDFFFGDERYVAFSDEANNGRMAAEYLFTPLQISSTQIHYINTALSQADAAADYAKQIESYFNGAPIRFDFVLLGLGDNAHTLSLFPHTTVLYEMKALVKALYIEVLQAWRITMTAPLVNEARQIVFFVYGKDKAEAVQQVLIGERNIEQYPAQIIEAEDGELHWFLDTAAAALL